MNVTFLNPNGERKIDHIQHGLRKLRAFPDYLGLYINKEGAIFHIQASLHEDVEKMPLEGLEKTLVFSLLSAARNDLSKHISFW